MLTNLKKDKRGIFGLDGATSFVIGILSIVLIAVVILMVLGSINTQSVKDATGNRSTNIIGNVSAGVDSLFANAGLWFTLLGVTIMILIVVVVIAVLKRSQGGGSTSL